jgi:hypothetical protein
MGRNGQAPRVAMRTHGLNWAWTQAFLRFSPVPRTRSQNMRQSRYFVAFLGRPRGSWLLSFGRLSLGPRIPPARDSSASANDTTNQSQVGTAVTFLAQSSIMQSSNCQIECGSVEAVQCGSPAVADRSDCGSQFARDCRTECCGESFCGHCYDSHMTHSCLRKPAKLMNLICQPAIRMPHS